MDGSLLALNRPVVLEFERGADAFSARGIISRISSREFWVQVPTVSPFDELSLGSPVLVRCWDEIQLYVFTSPVLEVTAGPPARLRLERPAQVRPLQRRNFFRVAAKVPFSYRKTEDEQPLRPTLTRDISGGGLCFAANEPMKIGDTLELAIRISPQRAVATQGRVVRVVERRSDTLVGVEFVTIDKSSQDALVGLVHELQRRQRI